MTIICLSSRGSPAHALWFQSAVRPACKALQRKSVFIANVALFFPSVYLFNKVTVCDFAKTLSSFQVSLPRVTRGILTRLFLKPKRSFTTLCTCCGSAFSLCKWLYFYSLHKVLVSAILIWNGWPWLGIIRGFIDADIRVFPLLHI